MGFAVWGLGFWVERLGSRIEGLWSVVLGKGFGVWDLEIRVHGLGFRVWGLVGYKVEGSGSGFRGWGFRIRIEDSGFGGLGFRV